MSVTASALLEPSEFSMAAALAIVGRGMWYSDSNRVMLLSSKASNAVRLGTHAVTLDSAKIKRDSLIADFRTIPIGLGPT